MEQQLLSDDTLPAYLCELGLASPGERIEVSPGGDGNINWVRRATLSGPQPRSVIVKQARPALERFPQYQAPTGRIVCEARYFEAVRALDVEAVCPQVLRFDEPNRVLVLEDLGEAERLDHAFARGEPSEPALLAVSRFLGRVHAGTRDRGDLVALFANEAMQRLHGEHIFVLPFQANDFPLPPRTAARGAELAQDRALCEAAAAAYTRYLTPAGALVHGDVQAGNVLVTAGGAKLLDAEIAHVGDPAFDIGMLLAHVMLPHAAAGHAPGAEPELERCWQAYARAHGSRGLAHHSQVLRYAGFELLRRTLGAARVASVSDDAAGLRVIEVGLAWVRGESALR